jgi:hypothetical protein
LANAFAALNDFVEQTGSAFGIQIADSLSPNGLAAFFNARIATQAQIVASSISSYAFNSKGRASVSGGGKAFATPVICSSSSATMADHSRKRNVRRSEGVEVGQYPRTLEHL